MLELGKRLVIGNWKMHLLQQDAVRLASAVELTIENIPLEKVTVGICPSFLSLHAVNTARNEKKLLLGGQDCHGKDEGAFTGNVSAAMLRDAACDFVIVGHSERRLYQHETNAEVQMKAQSAIKYGLHAIICVGETERQRKEGNYLQIVQRQLEESLPPDSTRSNVTISYEPVWAIGTGNNAGSEDISEMHEHIKKILHARIGAEIPRIIYGGSVKPNNALEIMSLPVVDGVLVGGASLDSSAFASIIGIASRM